MSELTPTKRSEQLCNLETTSSVLQERCTQNHCFKPQECSKCCPMIVVKAPEKKKICWENLSTSSLVYAELYRNTVK